MALPTYYNAGTVTVAAGGTAVSGVGTAWLAALQPGDLFTDASGLMVRIASIESDTALTLARAWPGGAIAGGAYEIQLTPRSVGVQEATRRLLLTLSNGNLSSIADLPTGADKMAYYTGEGTAALATLTTFARSLLAGIDEATVLDTLGVSAFIQTLLGDADDATARTTLGAQAALGFAPVQQGGLPGIPDHRIRLGWDNALRSYVDDTDIGKVWSDYSAPGLVAGAGYQKLPSGLIIQWGFLPNSGDSDVPVTFPITFPSAFLGALVSASGYPAGALVAHYDLAATTGMAIRRRGIATNGAVSNTPFVTSWMAWGS